MGKTPKELTPAQQARSTALEQVHAAERDYKETVTTLAVYIDPEGNKSTGSKGIAMQVNIRIKKHFGAGRDELSALGLSLVESAFIAIAERMRQESAAGLTRREIKDETYAIIEKFGAMYQEVRSV